MHEKTSLVTQTTAVETPKTIWRLPTRARTVTTTRTTTITRTTVIAITTKASTSTSTSTTTTTTTITSTTATNSITYGNINQNQVKKQYHGNESLVIDVRDASFMGFVSAEQLVQRKYNLG